MQEPNRWRKKNPRPNATSGKQGVFRFQLDAISIRPKSISCWAAVLEGEAMSLHDQFKNEEEFREQFIRPLLVRMGFSGIAQMHGSSEFGKDYVFSDQDRFGQWRHMAVQAKHEKSINQGAVVDKVVSQIKEAFSIPYSPLTPLGEQRRVSAVYVFNDGEITPNAREIIGRGVDEKLRPMTYVFSGHELETLQSVLFGQQEREVKGRLLGLRSQLLLNIRIWNGYSRLGTDDPGTEIDGRRPIMRAIEEWLTLPALPATKIAQNLLEEIWQHAGILDTIIHKVRMSGFSTIPRDMHKEQQVIRKNCHDAVGKAVVLCSQIETALANLPETAIGQGIENQ